MNNHKEFYLSYINSDIVTSNTFSTKIIYNELMKECIKGAINPKDKYDLYYAVLTLVFTK